MAVKTKYFPFGGGLDVSTPAISVPPGRLLSCLNFEPDVEGGYRFAPGYERYDGSPRPHVQDFVGFEVKAYIPDNFPHTVDGVEYADSDAWLDSFTPLVESPSYLDNFYGGEDRIQTRLICVRDDDDNEERAVARVVGFTDYSGENVSVFHVETTYRVGLFRVTGEIREGYVLNNRFVAVTSPLKREAPTALLELEWLRKVKRTDRMMIRSVPGAGPVRGAWHIDDRVYAWRDDQRGKISKVFEANDQVDRQTRIQTVKYADSAAPDAAGRMVIYDNERRTGLTSVASYRAVQLIHFHQSANPTSGAAPVSMSSVFTNVVPSDVIRLKGDDATGNVLEYIVMSTPYKVPVGATNAGSWRVEVEIIYADFGAGENPETINNDWIVEVETGIYPSPGWKAVDSSKFCQALKFDGGTHDVGIPWGEGTEITAINNFSATIHRLVDWAGGYANDDASGVLLLRNVVGTIADNAEIKAVPLGSAANTAAVKIATARGTLSPFTLQGGKRFRFDQHNFFAKPRAERIYGCGGDKAFEIDEDGYFSEIVIPTINELIDSGPDELSFGDFLFPVAHDVHLVLTLEGGKLIGSSVGHPLNFSSIVSAFEFGLGSEIVGCESVTGGALVVATQKSVQGIFGNVADGFKKRGVSDKQGILPDSIRKVDDVYGFSWAGVAGMTRTDQFGDFNSDTVSNAVRPLLKNLREYFTAASIVKSSNLYRLHFSGKYPHYELGAYRTTSVVGNVKPDTDVGARLVHLAQGANENERILVLPRLNAMQWVESAAGGDTYKATLTSRSSIAYLNSNGDGIYAGSTKLELSYAANNSAFFQRVDKSDTDYAGAVVYLRRNGDLYGTFTVTKRVVKTSTAANVVAFEGVYNPIIALVGGNEYALEIKAPSLIENGSGGEFMVRSRGVEHFYHVDTYESKGGSDPDTDTTAQCRVTLTRTQPINDDFLDGRQKFEEVQLAIKEQRDVSTEAIIMYVPESNSPSNARGVNTREGVEFGRTVIPVHINAMWECATPVGERIFFAGADGILYEDRVGSSHDGAEITAFLRTPFIHCGSPSHKKRLRQLDVELSSMFSLRFKVVTDLSYFAAQGPALLRQDEKITGEGGFWDTEDVWDGFNWDGVSVSHAYIDLVGSGINASFLFVFTADNIEDLVIQGMLLHYSRRRLER